MEFLTEIGAFAVAARTVDEAAWIAAAGVLSPRFTAVHATHLNTADIDKPVLEVVPLAAGAEFSVEIDPNYARAQAALAIACQVRASTDPTGDWLAQGQMAETRALQLAPMLQPVGKPRALALRHLPP